MVQNISLGHIGLNVFGRNASCDEHRFLMFPWRSIKFSRALREISRCQPIWPGSKIMKVKMQMHLCHIHCHFLQNVLFPLNMWNKTGRGVCEGMTCELYDKTTGWKVLFGKYFLLWQFFWLFLVYLYMYVYVCVHVCVCVGKYNPLSLQI